MYIEHCSISENYASCVVMCTSAAGAANKTWLLSSAAHVAGGKDDAGLVVPLLLRQRL